MGDGKATYDRLRDHVREHLAFYTYYVGCGPANWHLEDFSPVIEDAMRDTSTHPSELPDALLYAIETHLEPCVYSMAEARMSVLELIGSAIASEIANRVRKVGHVVCDGWRHPVYRDGDTYAIDLGGAVGLTDFIPFDTQEEAFRRFEMAARGEEC